MIVKNQAEKTILSIALLTLLASLFSIYPFLNSPLLKGYIFRVFFIAFLFLLVYKKKNWARLVLIGILAGSSLIALNGIDFLKHNITIGIFFISMGIVYAFSTYILVTSKLIKNHLKKQS